MKQGEFMVKLKVGNLFTIPVDDELTGFGQIIKIPNKSNFIIVVFENIYSGTDWPNILEIINSKILFLGFTMDALLYHGKWKIIGTEISNISGIQLPYYKLGTPPKMKLINYKDETIRKLSQEEFDRLEYMTVSSPITFENALKAYHGKYQWNKDYETLFYDLTLESVRIAKKTN